MKKLISIICAVLLLFSFSAVAYADYVEASGDVTVSATLGEFTPLGKVDTFETHIVEGEETTKEGRTFKIIYAVKNDTDVSIKANEVLKDFNVVIITENTKKIPTTYKQGFISKTDISINSGEIREFVYEKKVETSESVKIYIEFNGKRKDVQLNDCYFNIEYKEEASSTKVTETSNIVESTEISTLTSTAPTAPTESTKSHTATIIVDLPDSPQTDAPVEDEIPNTGSTKAIYAVAALAIAGATALLIIKKKSDEENWT